MRMRPDQSEWRKGRLVVGLIFGLLAAHVNEVSAMIDQQRLHRGVNGPLGGGGGSLLLLLSD